MPSLFCILKFLLILVYLRSGTLIGLLLWLYSFLIPFVVQYLLDAGADPNVQAEEGRTPLHIGGHGCCHMTIETIGTSVVMVNLLRVSVFSRSTLWLVKCLVPIQFSPRRARSIHFGDNIIRGFIKYKQKCIFFFYIYISVSM